MNPGGSKILVADHWSLVADHWSLPGHWRLVNDRLVTVECPLLVLYCLIVE